MVQVVPLFACIDTRIRIPPERTRKPVRCVARTNRSAWGTICGMSAAPVPAEPEVAGRGPGSDPPPVMTRLLDPPLPSGMSLPRGANLEGERWRRAGDDPPHAHGVTEHG